MLDGIVSRWRVTMASITHDETTQDAIGLVPARPAAVRRTSNVAMIIADVLALLGIVATGIALFMRGWVHVQVVFVKPGRGATWILDTFGLDVNKEVSQLADREVAKSVPPTLWQFHEPYIQYAFGLLVVVAVLLL